MNFNKMMYLALDDHFLPVKYDMNILPGYRTAISRFKIDLDAPSPHPEWDEEMGKQLAEKRDREVVEKLRKGLI